MKLVPLVCEDEVDSAPTVLGLNWLYQGSSQKYVSVKSHINPFKPTGFFHSYYLEKSILHFRGVRLIFSSSA